MAILNGVANYLLRIRKSVYKMSKEFIAANDFFAISEIPAFSLVCDYVLAVGTFLEDFYQCDVESKIIALSDEPEQGILEKVQYCKLAAAAHKLANDFGLPVPEWALKDEYIMPYHVYAYGSQNTDFHERLKEITPHEYKIRNLFLGASVLTRV